MSRRELETYLTKYGFREPDRACVINAPADTEFREARPNYDKANLEFVKGKTQNHKKGKNDVWQFKKITWVQVCFHVLLTWLTLLLILLSWKNSAPLIPVVFWVVGVIGLQWGWSPSHTNHLAFRHSLNKPSIPTKDSLCSSSGYRLTE